MFVFLKSYKKDLAKSATKREHNENTEESTNRNGERLTQNDILCVG
jgi:hypothetical protein